MFCLIFLTKPLIVAVLVNFSKKLLGIQDNMSVMEIVVNQFLPFIYLFRSISNPKHNGNVIIYDWGASSLKHYTRNKNEQRFGPNYSSAGPKWRYNEIKKNWPKKVYHISQWYTVHNH